MKDLTAIYILCNAQFIALSYKVSSKHDRPEVKLGFHITHKLP
jgi:hypothetical protein